MGGNIKQIFISLVILSAVKKVYSYLRDLVLYALQCFVLVVVVVGVTVDTIFICIVVVTLFNYYYYCVAVLPL